MQNASLNWRIMRVQHSYVSQIAKVIHSNDFFRTSAREIGFHAFHFQQPSTGSFSIRESSRFFCVENFFTISGIFNTLPKETFLALELFLSVFPFLRRFLGKCLRRIGCGKSFPFSHSWILFFRKWNSFSFLMLFIWYRIKHLRFAPSSAERLWINPKRKKRSENFTHSTLSGFSSTFTLLCVWRWCG